MVSSLDVLTLFVVVAIGGSVILWLIQRNKPLKKEFKLVVFTEGKTYRETKTSDNDEETFSIDSREYPCKKVDAWITPLQWGDRLLKRIEARYLFLYRLPKKTAQQKGEPEPVILNKGKEAENSSQILWKVKKYRGVKEGIEDQFKQPAAFNIPSWALIVVVIALLLLGVVLLEQMGYLGGGA